MLQILQPEYCQIMGQVENSNMAITLYFLFNVLFVSNAQEFSSWNKILVQTSGPKNCPQGDLVRMDSLHGVRIGERLIYLTGDKGKSEILNIPGCVENFRTTFDVKKNEFTKLAKVSKCIQPMDDMEYTETLRMNALSRTLRYMYHHKKTKILEKKFICRYSFR